MKISRFPFPAKSTAAIAFVLFAAVAFAGSGPQHWTTLSQPAQFKQLKAGDKIAYVCNQCKTVSAVTIEMPEQAMDHCKEGAALTCPSCKAKVKLVTRGSPKNQSTSREITYVNEKGEECFFIAKVADKS